MDQRPTRSLHHANSGENLRQYYSVVARRIAPPRPVLGARAIDDKEHAIAATMATNATTPLIVPAHPFLSN
jgi:hypothetical protein